MRLLTKHWNAIAARKNADAPHVPQIDFFGEEAMGKAWARGFIAGMNLCAEPWDALMDNDRVGDIAAQILALATDGGLLEDSTRAAIVDELPDIVRIIAAYWASPTAFPARNMPLRSQKTGRNELCPCGSGKKYKKCCGLNGGPTLH